MTSVDVWNAVMPCQPFVHERVVRAEQIENAAVLANDAFEEHLRLAPERQPQVVVEIRELMTIRLNALQVSQVQPLTGEVANERIGFAIREHSLHLLIENSRIPQLALRGQVEKLVVRNTAPEEERQ